MSDVVTISQQWARYAAVRDATPAFEGAIFPGDYLRSQYDPSRDFRVLKSPNAMVASEGVVASALFWTVATQALKAGAHVHGGLDQPALLETEGTLMSALQQAARTTSGSFRPDVLDVVSACGPPLQSTAITCWIDVTRGVTVDASQRARWSTLYASAVHFDYRILRPLLDAEIHRRTSLHSLPANRLRDALGTVLPVRAAAVTLHLLGEPCPLEFDLNAISMDELLSLGQTPATAQRVLDERDRRPFASLSDFQARTGLSCGLAEIH